MSKASTQISTHPPPQVNQGHSLRVSSGRPPAAREHQARGQKAEAQMPGAAMSLWLERKGQETCRCHQRHHRCFLSDPLPVILSRTRFLRGADIEGRSSSYRIPTAVPMWHRVLQDTPVSAHLSLSLCFCMNTWQLPSGAVAMGHMGNTPLGSKWHFIRIVIHFYVIVRGLADLSIATCAAMFYHLRMSLPAATGMLTSQRGLCRDSNPHSWPTGMQNSPALGLIGP